MYMVYFTSTVLLVIEAFQKYYAHIMVQIYQE